MGLEKIYSAAHAIKIITIMFISKYYKLQLSKKIYKIYDADTCNYFSIDNILGVFNGYTHCILYHIPKYKDIIKPFMGSISI